MVFKLLSESIFNPLTPNDHYRGHTTPLTSKHCSLYIYSTNIGTEYFKHGIYSSFLFLQNAVCFIILTYLVPVLFTFYIQCVLKLKKNNSGAKRLTANKGFYGLKRQFTSQFLSIINKIKSYKTLITPVLAYSFKMRRSYFRSF